MERSSEAAGTMMLSAPFRGWRGMRENSHMEKIRDSSPLPTGSQLEARLIGYIFPTGQNQTNFTATTCTNWGKAHAAWIAYFLTDAIDRTALSILAP
jgi:hypothetical protein